MSDDQMFTVPEDLTALDDAAFSTLHSQVKARGAELAAQANLSDDDLAELQGLADEDERFGAEADRRAALAAERAALAAKAAARFATATADADADAAADEEPAAPAAEDPAPAADEEPAAEPVVASAAARTKFRTASPQALRTASKASEIVPAATKTEMQFMSATAHASSPEGTRFESVADVAKALHKKRMSFGNIGAGVNEMISIATGTKQFDADVPSLGLDPQQNLVTLRDVQHALVASGACCTPQTQLYDFFRLAQPIRDVEDAIPTVQAPRGGIRFIAANCSFADAAGAVDFWDCTDSITPGAQKPCARVVCPEIQEVLVQTISQCTIFDNLQYRTFPELIEDFMEDVAVQFTLRKQRFYLDSIDAASTITTGIGSYGAVRSMMYDLMVAAAAYRKRNHMPRTARLQVMIPDWAIDVLKADMFNDGDEGLQHLCVPDSALIEGLQCRGLDPTFYYDERTAALAGNELFQPQVAGPLNDYPTVARSYLYAPGTFVKLDGGTLDVGLVRDHQLNLTNDFAMFMEEFLGFAQLGCESIAIDSTICPSGSRAGYAPALRTCT